MSVSRAAPTLGLLTALMCGLWSARPVDAQKKPSGAATLSGRVLSDSLERPIAGARVSVPALNLSAVTDSLGRYRLAGIKPGTQFISVSTEGFHTLRTTMTFVASDSVDADILLTPTAAGEAQPVAPVNVTADAVPRGLEDFERRRLGGIGDFITGDVIAKNAHGQFAEAVRRIPGIVLSRPESGFGAYATAGRGAGRTRNCFLAVMIDRSWVYEGRRGELPFDLSSIAPETIAAVEYYRGTSYIPVELDKVRNTCGVLVIWTRRG